MYLNNAVFSEILRVIMKSCINYKDECCNFVNLSLINEIMLHQCKNITETM